MYHQTELFQSLFIFVGCIILAFGIGFYVFNNKFMQRKNEVEKLESSRFKVSKLNFPMLAALYSSMIGMMIGAFFIFHALRFTNIFSLAYTLLMFIFICVSILFTKIMPLCFLTDEHLYIYPYWGLSSAYKKYELEKLKRVGQDSTEDFIYYYKLYDGDKNIRYSLLAYGMKEQKAIMEFLKNKIQK